MMRHAKSRFKIATGLSRAAKHPTPFGLTIALVAFGFLIAPVSAEEPGLLTYSIRPSASSSLLILAGSLSIASISGTLTNGPESDANLAAPSQRIEWTPDLTLALSLKPTVPDRLHVPFRKLKLGFGQFFTDDTIGRARTNGAGLDDPWCLFVKLVFRF
jgi:hypothetical protein